MCCVCVGRGRWCWLARKKESASHPPSPSEQVRAIVGAPPVQRLPKKDHLAAPPSTVGLRRADSRRSLTRTAAAQRLSLRERCTSEDRGAHSKELCRAMSKASHRSSPNRSPSPHRSRAVAAAEAEAAAGAAPDQAPALGAVAARTASLPARARPLRPPPSPKSPRRAPSASRPRRARRQTR